MTETGQLLETGTAGYLRLLECVDEASAVGGKAWNLSRMLRLGLPVPRGFVLTDQAFQHFLAENQLHDPIDAVYAGVQLSDLQTLHSASVAITAKIASATVPEALIVALREGRRQLAAGGTLIVRSSAVGEDSGNSSFAGQLDSFRDITSEPDLVRAVTRCWASCWSERSLYYQISRGVRIARMGVVVQEQVPSQAAGVLFTVSPDTVGAAGEMMGEYCFGHGEDLVSGRINPGRFTISRKGFRRSMLTEPEQPDLEPGRQCPLDEAALRRLRQIGLQLEREFEGAQDIEWAMDGEGRVHVVQSRPVTVPAPKAQPAGFAVADPGCRRVIWSNANINENYPDPVSPFLYSVAADGYYHYFRNLAYAFGITPDRIEAMEAPLRGVVGVHCARLYYNLSNIHAALRMAPFGEHLVDSFNIFVGAGEVSQVASFGGRQRGGLMKLAELCRTAVKTAWQFLFLEQRVTRFEKTADDYAGRFHPERLKGMPLTGLHEALRAFHDIRCHRWTNASLADAASMIGYGLLKRQLARAFPESEHAALHNTLLQGLPDLVSARPSGELWRLSRHIGRDERLKQLFAMENCGEIWTLLTADPRFAAFRSELEKYLETWGFRRSGELMLTVESFQEDPRGVLALLKNYSRLDGSSPTQALQRQEEDRLAETRRVLGILGRRKLLAPLPWPSEATVLARVLRWTQTAIALRERARLKQSLIYSRCRRVLLRIGEELVARGFLLQREDVFFLTYQELGELMSGYALLPQAALDLVKLRRQEQARLGGATPPDSFVLPEGSYLPAERPATGDAAAVREAYGEAMTGIGACGGQVTARAAVLSDVSESGRLAAGDILVTRQTDPGWAPIFFLVKGLVMERGGMLSHGAIIAREYGIPTVVGVREATKRIPSGVTVTVDGDAGCVRLVD